MALAALPGGEQKHALVRAMFDRIAPRYDAMNRLLTAGLDQRWRAAALDAIGVAAGDRVLDLACGTGDLAHLARRRGACVVGVDFSAEMLRRAHRRDAAAAWVQGDAVRLPLRDACLDAVSCGFALRNFVALPEVFRELRRVLVPGGRIALIDVDRPDPRWLRAAHSLYFDRVVPVIGGLLSDRAAYRYLPQSTAYLPPAAELLGMLAAAGFERLVRRSLGWGSAQILTGASA